MNRRIQGLCSPLCCVAANRVEFGILIENPWLKAITASTRLGFEAYYVARMRLARFAAGGYRAQHELTRMERERQAIQIQARMQLAEAMASGRIFAIPLRFASLCRGMIHENYQRLSEH